MEEVIGSNLLFQHMRRANVQGDEVPFPVLGLRLMLTSALFTVLKFLLCPGKSSRSQLPLMPV